MPVQWLALLEEGVERYLHSQERFSLTQFGFDLAGSSERAKAHFYGGTDHWKSDDACRRFACTSPLPQIAAQILKATRVNLYEDSILVKEPGAGEPTAFHQDLAYFHVDGSQICTTWTPLDPVTSETGALQFVRASHLWKKLYRPNFFVTTLPLPDTDGEEAPDYHRSFHSAEKISFDTMPGDITVHHALTLHGAFANQSATKRRRAMSVRYCGDDARYRLRRGAPRKAHHNEVRDGDLLDHPDCPLVWRA